MSQTHIQWSSNVISNVDAIHVMICINGQFVELFFAKFLFKIVKIKIIVGLFHT